MNRFVELLSCWQGRSFVQRELESPGYLLPRRYKEFVAAVCSSNARQDLDKYWDEEAREYICSAGQTDTAMRSFPDFACYRSEYLDSLAAVRQDSLFFKVTSLHRTLSRIMTDLNSSAPIFVHRTKKGPASIGTGPEIARPGVR
jgi:hypothetical protein